MTQLPLNILLIEDSADDAELVAYELRRHGYDVHARRVWSAPALHDALTGGPWDIALSDHNLPGFASHEAQAIVNASTEDVPFVILSGTIGEEATVEALRSGARDVVLKSNLSRLGLVVDRVLADSEQRRRHRAAEFELEESNARKTAILDSALDCIVSVDHEGLIVDFNPAAEETFGYLRDEVRGKRMADLIIPPSLRDEHRTGFMRHLESGRSSILGRRLELTAMRSDGSEFPVEVAITRSDTGNGEQPFFTAYLRDVTAAKQALAERERLEHQLRHAQKMEAIGSLAGGVAHDFNNILTVIRAASSFLEREIGEQQQRHRAGAADRPRRDARGRAHPAAARVQPSAGAEAGVGRPQRGRRRDAAAARPRDEREHPAQRRPRRSLRPVLVDRVQLQQVILNLLVNARDAMPHGGVLELRTGNAELGLASEEERAELEPGPYVVLQVADSGIGMDESTRERIFEPVLHHQGRRQRTRALDGLRDRHPERRAHLRDERAGAGEHVQGLLPGRDGGGCRAPDRLRRRGRCGGRRPCCSSRTPSSCARSSPRCSSPSATRF